MHCGGVGGDFKYLSNHVPAERTKGGAFLGDDYDGTGEIDGLALLFSGGISVFLKRDFVPVEINQREQGFFFCCLSMEKVPQESRNFGDGLLGKWPVAVEDLSDEG